MAVVGALQTLAKRPLPGIKAKPPGQRLPVPAGWRFCWCLVERQGSEGLAGIKCEAAMVEAPSHGQAMARLSWL